MEIEELEKEQPGFVEIPRLLSGINTKYSIRIDEEHGKEVLLFADYPDTPQLIKARETCLEKLLELLVGAALNRIDHGDIRFGFRTRKGCYTFFVYFTDRKGGLEKQGDVPDKAGKRMSESVLAELAMSEDEELVLTECKKLINSMNGELWFEPFDGKGSSWYFTIPDSL